MAQIYWTNPVSGYFSKAADWSGQTVPGAEDDAILDAKGAAFTVTVKTNRTVNSLQTTANATLSITAGTFTETNGSGSGKNAGVTMVGNGASLAISGTITNPGRISLDSAGGRTALIVAAQNATIVGGQVSLTDNADNMIAGILSGSTGHQTVSVLTNRGTISGAGTIGTDLILDNAGIVDAVGTSALILAVGNSVVAGSDIIANSGVLEASNKGSLSATGGLELQNVVIANSTSGRIVAADATSHVDLTGVTVQGGALVTSGGGVINILGSADVFDGSTQSITNSGTVVVGPGDYLHVAGSLAGKGWIDLDGSGLGVGANATLGAGGHLVMSDSAANEVDIAYGITLTSAATISGAGNINGYLDNMAGGVIDATGTNTLSLNVVRGSDSNAGLIESVGAGGLTIDAYDVFLGFFTNTGTLEETGAGALTFYGGRMTNTGVILASGGGGLRLVDSRIYNTGGTIELRSNLYMGYGRVKGGILSVTSNVTISASRDNNQLYLDTILNQGTINFDNTTDLKIQGDFVETGAFNVDGGGLYLTSTVGDAIGPGSFNVNDGTLGLVGTLSAGSHIDVMSSNSRAGFSTTNLGDTIVSSGYIYGGIINQTGGVIDSIGAGVMAVGVTNYGLVESSSSGVSALGGRNFSLITVSGSGVVEIDGVLNNYGTLSDTGSGGVRMIGGTLQNDGYISPISSLYMNRGDIDGYGALSITKTGLVTVGGGASNVSELDILTLVNQGTIDAGSSSLSIVTTGAGDFTNTGTLEVAGGFLSIAFCNGAGTAIINGGTFRVGTFGGSVTFAGSTGTLNLVESQTFQAKISGFSTKGTTSLDLDDIVFRSGVTKATFVDNGQHTGGVLTVTDGENTAHLNLVGDFVGSTFTTSSDGNGGTIVVDPEAGQGANAATSLMISAMASLTVPGADATHSTPRWPCDAPSSLAAPRMANLE